MSEFITQYIETTIAASSPSKTLSAADGDFDQIADPTRTLVLPAGSMHTTAGLGWQSGTFDVSWRAQYISADLADDNTLTFTRGFAAVSVSRCGLNLISYVGPAGGPNEFIRRSKQTVTLATGQTQVDSAAITGVTSFSKLFAQVFTRSDLNSSDARHIAVRVSPINTAGTYTIRLNRSASSGNIVADVYVYEMIGANWVPQWFTKTLTGTSGDTTTITSAAIANTFLLRTFSEAQTTGGPANTSPLVWQSAATTLAYRCPAVNTTIVNTWVLTNSSMTVQQVSNPDGTADFAAGSGSAEQVLPFSFTNPVDPTRSIVLGQAGSADTTAANHGSEQWLFKFTSATAGSARRGRSFGATEHVLQAVQFPLDAPTVTGISSPIRTGSNVVLDGTKFKPDGSTAPTLHMGADSVSLSASSDIQVTGGATIGSQIFGDKNWQLTTAIGSSSITAPILPPSGETYFDLSGGLAPTGIITAIPALLETAQVWAKELKDSANVTKDVTNTALFRILPDGRPELDASISVPATVKLAANNNNGSGWGAFATITIDTSIVKPVVETIPPLALSVGTEVQFDLSLYASGEETVVIATGALPPGLSITGAGFVVGTPTTAGTYTVTVEYENDAGPEVSPDFVLSVYVAPSAIAVPNLYYLVGAAVSFDLNAYGSDFDSVHLIGSLPPGLEFASGVITGTPTVAGIFGAQARYSNAGPTPADSNIFRMVEGRARVRQMTTSQASPRRRRFFQ